VSLPIGPFSRGVASRRLLIPLPHHIQRLTSARSLENPSPRHGNAANALTCISNDENAGNSGAINSATENFALKEIAEHRTRQNERNPRGAAIEQLFFDKSVPALSEAGREQRERRLTAALGTQARHRRDSSAVRNERELDTAMENMTIEDGHPEAWRMVVEKQSGMGDKWQKRVKGWDFGGK
jgi:hypothetical protein